MLLRIIGFDAFSAPYCYVVKAVPIKVPDGVQALVVIDPVIAILMVATN